MALRQAYCDKTTYFYQKYFTKNNHISIGISNVSWEREYTSLGPKTLIGTVNNLIATPRFLINMGGIRNIS